MNNTIQEIIMRRAAARPPAKKLPKDVIVFGVIVGISMWIAMAGIATAAIVIIIWAVGTFVAFLVAIGAPGNWLIVLFLLMLAAFAGPTIKTMRIALIRTKRLYNDLINQSKNA